LGDLEGIATHRLDVRDGDAVITFSDAVSTSNVLFNWSVFARKRTILECDELIASMASVASTIIAAWNRFVYCANKAAVIGRTKPVAADFVTKNVRANAIYAGTI
jgi:2-keto-3-deoxy-L-fuconate dehydrogenase